MIYNLFSFHSLPFFLSRRGVYHLQRSVSRLSFFSAFKICFSLFSVSCQPSKLLPANTGTQREKKRQPLLHSPGSDSPKLPLAHRSWLHSFLNANQMRSCNVWQHFFFLQRETDVCQKCRLLGILAQWYKNKFTFIPEIPLFLAVVGPLLYDLE